MSESRWSCLHATSEGPDSGGDISLHAVMCAESGQVFTVSVSGHGIASIREFILAIQAAAAAYALNLGGTVLGARLLTPEKVN